MHFASVNFDNLRLTRLVKFGFCSTEPEIVATVYRREPVSISHGNDAVKLYSLQSPDKHAAGVLRAEWTILPGNLR